MASSGLTLSIIVLMRLQEDILRVHHDLEISDGCVGGKQVARSLETSQQKLQVWQTTWLDQKLDITITSTALWGTQGLTEIQKLLQTISNTTQKIDVAVREHSKFMSRPSFSNIEKTQVTKPSGVKTRYQPPWKWTLPKNSEKKSPTVIVKSPTMLELATELSSSIDELWTYSEVAFNSLHGLLATRAVDPPSRHFIGKLLADTIRTRTASIALYRACSKSTRNCSLELDLFGAKALLRRGGPGSSGSPFSLFYHLFTQTHDSPAKMRDMTIESVARPGTRVAENNEIVVYENPDLADFDIESASNTGILIRPKRTDTASYFRVAKLPASYTLIPETQNLAQILYKGKVSSTTSSARTLPFSARIELAFKLVESALYLLGTPWLASLNSKRLRQMNTPDGRQPYVLEVQTLDLDELSFEDPEALAEPSQLFRIGVLLVEIALGNPEHSVPTDIQERDLRTSKMLTLVQQSMGPQYCKATAFCLHNRRWTSYFGLPEKYQYPEKTGWKSYLLELLEDYHAQVFLR
ncbi:MAG: hypothetical protein ASARMPREDX12_003533 [Alectoria sarmentosa]|nr:MAG: hypothetical protein ASARMPREDX12_003533 [Alectoria sarmentosa]